MAVISNNGTPPNSTYGPFQKRSSLQQQTALRNGSANQLQQTQVVGGEMTFFYSGDVLTRQVTVDPPTPTEEELVLALNHKCMSRLA